jgi:hypothetical protein
MRSAVFVFLIACGGGTKTQPSPDPAPPPPPAQDKPAMAQTDTRPACTEADIPCALDTLDYFSKKMCGCKDKACADAINNDMTNWGTEMSKKAPAKNQQPSEAEQKRLMASVNAYTECMTKLMMEGATPPPDPCGGGDPCGE